MQDRRAPEKLRQFQLAYGRYLRNPDGQTLPEGVPKRRSEIYEGLIFNNISGFINSCFPVARSLHTEEAWQALIRVFFKEWRCTTPIFSQIPFEFVGFVSKIYVAETPISETSISETRVAKSVPAWLPELLHYEWIELEIDLKEHTEQAFNQDVLRVNPLSALLSYHWPVHTISKNAIPEEPEQVFIIVYRNQNHKVRFLALNATTFMLLQHIQEYPGEASTVVSDFVTQMNVPEPDKVFAFAMQILRDLKQQEIVFGEIK